MLNFLFSTSFIVKKIVGLLKYLAERTDNKIDDFIVEIVNFLLIGFVGGKALSGVLGHAVLMILKKLAASSDNKIDDKVVGEIEKILEKAEVL